MCSHPCHFLLGPLSQQVAQVPFHCSAVTFANANSICMKTHCLLGPSCPWELRPLLLLHIPTIRLNPCIKMTLLLTDHQLSYMHVIFPHSHNQLKKVMTGFDTGAGGAPMLICFPNMQTWWWLPTYRAYEFNIPYNYSHTQSRHSSISD